MRVSAGITAAGRPGLRAGERLWLLALLALAVLLVAYPGWADEYAVSSLRDVLLFGLFALSLDYLWGKTGTLSFGHATFFGLGTYGVAITAVKLQADPAYAALLGLAMGIALAALVLVQGTVLTWWHAFARTRAWAERSPREFVRELLPEVDRARLGTLGFNADALDFYAGQTLEAWGEGRFARPLEDLADRLKREPDPRPYTLLLMEANRRSGRDARTTAERLEAMGLAWERVPVRAVYRRPPGDARVLAWRVWARGSGPG